MLLEENRNLKGEITRLKEDNSAFLKQARRADAERDEAMVSKLVSFVEFKLMLTLN